MRNIEFKARLADLAEAERTARRLGADDRGVIPQTDTYFNTRSGRLKIRRIGDETGGQLVAYDRSDRPEARACDYALVETPDAEALTDALARTLGVRSVVVKRRHLFLWKNIRIHLDRVDGLGEFLEFEAVLGPGDDAGQARRDLERLRAEFGVRPEDIQAVSYGDMAEAGESGSEE